MKRDFLKNLDLGNGAHLTDDLIDQIMAEAGKTKTEMQNTITSLTTERDGLQAQLSDANATIQSYKDMDIDGIKQSAADWETKYNTDTQALKDQLESTKYGYAVENAVDSLKFTSESAKKAFLAELTAKKLPIQEGKLLGLEDFTKIDWILIHPPHAGRDAPSAPIMHRLSPFQSTLPMRGGTARSVVSAYACKISIHPPHAGRDILRRMRVPVPTFDATRYRILIRDILRRMRVPVPDDFNPPSPCGEGHA